MLKKAKSGLALALSFAMLLTSIGLTSSADDETGAETNNLEIVRFDPTELDWNGKEVAYIDFSDIAAGDVPASGELEGYGLSVLTNESTGNTRASNVVENGYMLLGKSARNNDNEADKAEKPIVTGAIYIKLDETLENKAGQPYVVKVDYYGGNMKADDAVNGGSYIDLCHNSSAGNNTKVRNTYGTTWQLNADATMYHELPEADFAENIGSCGADFRLETWTGATLRIRRISVLSYEPLEIPEMTEVDPGKTIATGDFGDLMGEATDKLTNGVLTGVVQGNGLSLVTTESTGNTRGSNILEDGYLLLGKEARQNDNPADDGIEAKSNRGCVFQA